MMAGRSKISRLPPEIREEVDRIIREGRMTQRELLSHLRSLGVQTSTGAVAGYVKRANQQMQRYREAQEVAKVWVGKLTEEPNGDVSRLIIEMLRTVAFQRIGQMSDEDEPIAPGDLMQLGRMIRDVAQADSLHATRLLAVRKEVVKEAAEAAGREAKSAGMSEEVEQRIRRSILGIAT